MPPPKGTLTAAQMEILETVWNAGSVGATVAGIWQALSARKPVARTTVLTQVSRLEKRGWLLRQQEAGRSFRYRAARDPSQAAGGLAARFVDEFFDGSASQLVMSLLGTRRIKNEELRRLRAILAGAEESRLAEGGAGVSSGRAGVSAADAFQKGKEGLV